MPLQQSLQCNVDSDAIKDAFTTLLCLQRRCNVLFVSFFFNLLLCKGVP